MWKNLEQESSPTQSVGWMVEGWAERVKGSLSQICMTFVLLPLVICFISKIYEGAIKINKFLLHGFSEGGGDVIHGLFEYSKGFLVKFGCGVGKKMR